MKDSSVAYIGPIGEEITSAKFFKVRFRRQFESSSLANAALDPTIVNVDVPKFRIEDIVTLPLEISCRVIPSPDHHDIISGAWTSQEVPFQEPFPSREDVFILKSFDPEPT